MAITRRLARPLLAAVFITGGIETLRLCNLKVRMPSAAAPPQLAA